MPLNLIKSYNQLLDFGAHNDHQRKQSLLSVFNRDFAHNPDLSFKKRPIQPTPKNGEIPMATLYTHLTTVITDTATRQRTFDFDRSCRLHWVRFHIDERKSEDVLHFSVQEPEGIRTYIYDITEKYVVILEPLKKVDAYYLLTAYYLTGKDAKRDKILQKYKRKLNAIH